MISKHIAARTGYFIRSWPLRVLLLALLLTDTADSMAQIAAPEYQIKAAFLYQFPAYVEWPASSFADATSPIVFGMLDADAIADELAAISNDKLVGGRPIDVRKLAPGDDTDGLHVLFVGEFGTRTSELLLLQALEQAALTITEAPARRPNGSTINFAIIDDRVRFDVSLAMAKQAGLTISSRLLQLARRVIEPDP